MRALRHIILAVAAIAAGAALWSAGVLQQRKLAARHDFLMMRFGPPVNVYDDLRRATRFLPEFGFVARWRAALRAERAESRYWMADYDVIDEGSEGNRAAEGRDAALLMLAANAAYRQAVAASPSAEGLERLEAIAAMYREIIEADPRLVDAAYNYEFVLRMRDQLATRRAVATPPPVSVHGVPGATPAETDMSDFKIIVPQGPDQRLQQPDAGLGGAKPRRG